RGRSSARCWRPRKARHRRSRSSGSTWRAIAPGNARVPRMAEPVVSNVSDTARWVTILRAWETARPDGLFRDPYAERLGGRGGKRIAERFRSLKSTANGWPVITRTKLMDDLVLRSIGDGCDCVLNLAAGLDTRPYRLALPR